MMGLEAFISSVFFDAMYDDIVLSRSACIKTQFTPVILMAADNSDAAPPLALLTSNLRTDALIPGVYREAA